MNRRHDKAKILRLNYYIMSVFILSLFIRYQCKDITAIYDIHIFDFCPLQFCSQEGSLDPLISFICVETNYLLYILCRKKM